MKLLRCSLLAFVALCLCVLPLRAASDTVLVEAESFENPGGWSLDTQFIEIMGSPYLLAHGLGEPVKDAATKVSFPGTGTWRVWVRTKDWVGRWNAPGAPGKFQVLVNGQPLPETFGTKGTNWFWHDGGVVEITQPTATVALHDLTGFEGRCDAILFSKNPAFVPPNDPTPLAAWRRNVLGLPAEPEDGGTYDLVVVGGGYSGMGAAISAARMGAKVALIQNRGVLGGNGSSEVRVWAMGGTRRGIYPNLGEIVEEFMDRAKSSPGTFEEFGDATKEALVRAEKNISLFFYEHAFGVEMDGKRLKGVLTLNTKTSHVKRFRAKLFADCTGHGSIGAMAGADLTVKEEEHLGMSNMWRWKTNATPIAFPETPWALPLTMDDFPYPKREHAEWFWESGFNKDPLKDLEYTRDWNFRAIYGAFNAMKNKDGKAEHLNAQLEWVAYIGGTRESRQLLGDVVLTREDISNKKPFPDGCVPTTWDIDLHYPKEQYAKKFPEDPFISKAVFDKSVDREHGYPVPYRCFYSRNIENLFMAGRCISVTHEALGTVRVMKTGGMVGEVVGKAASICLQSDCSPRDVYEKHLKELQDLMRLRGVARRDTVGGPIYIPKDAPTLPPVPPTKPAAEAVTVASLPGIVVDDAQAKLEGKWTKGEGLKGFVGSHYQYAAAGAKASARFEFTVPASGNYEVRFAYQPHENRASAAPVRVKYAGGEKEVKLNLRQPAPVPPTFISLGTFHFEASQPGAVEISNEGANGFIHADAVQVLPGK